MSGFALGCCCWEVQKGRKKQYNLWQQNKALYFTSTGVNGKTSWPYWSQLILYKTWRCITEISLTYYRWNHLYLTGNVIPLPLLEFQKDLISENTVSCHKSSVSFTCIETLRSIYLKKTCKKLKVPAKFHHSSPSLIELQHQPADLRGL